MGINGEASKLTDHVYADTSGEGKGNIGAIELDDYTVVVDSTISSTNARIFRISLDSQVETPIRKLLLTHYHSDHTLGIPAFKDCEIIANEHYIRLKRSTKYQPTQTFEGSHIIGEGDLQVEFVLAGGHTRDSSYIYFPFERILFSGDLIFAKTFFYAGDSTFNPETWLDVLNRLLSMKIELVVPGHGPVCSKDEILAYAKFFADMCSRVKELVKAGAKEKEVLRYESFPVFYPEYRKGVRTIALSNWYKFYKQKFTNE